MQKRILIINGPNLNMLGVREPRIYGIQTLEEMNACILSETRMYNIEVEFFHSNHEGELIDKIQAAFYNGVDGVVINPGAYTHYSYALRDAITSVDIPFVEVHLSNIDIREKFRRVSVIKDVCVAQIIGKGYKGYVQAVKLLSNRMEEKILQSIADTQTLNNGIKMPKFGLGVYQAKPGKEVYRAVRCALEAGYRLIDTAAFYHNEADVGKAVKDSGIPREELFLVTKLWPLEFRSALSAFEQSLAFLNSGYVDLYLMHWPGTDSEARLKGWETMQELQQKGLIRALGVSNFYIHHLEHLIEHTGMVPSNNQIELHPWQQQRNIRTYCIQKGISVTAWGPIFHGHLSEEPLMGELGEKYGKSAAQVTLRWHIQHDINVIPKSVRPDRIQENTKLFDFALDQEDMARIDALDGKGAFAFNADLFDGNV
jgi:3-dehydroquinate dehydratase type II